MSCKLAGDGEWNYSPGIGKTSKLACLSLAHADIVITFNLYAIGDKRGPIMPQSLRNLLENDAVVLVGSCVHIECPSPCP